MEPRQSPQPVPPSRVGKFPRMSSGDGAFLAKMYSTLVDNTRVTSARVNQNSVVQIFKITSVKSVKQALHRIWQNVVLALQEIIIYVRKTKYSSAVASSVISYVVYSIVPSASSTSVFICMSRMKLSQPGPLFTKRTDVLPQDLV